MIAMAIAPRAVSRRMFGEDIATAPGVLVARSWGTIISLSGLMLIYAAWHPEARLPVMLFSILGKLSFVLQVFADAKSRRAPAAFAAAGDLIIIALFGWYLAG